MALVYPNDGELYCEDCAREWGRRNELTEEGESDSPSHCAECHPTDGSGTRGCGYGSGTRRCTMKRVARLLVAVVLVWCVLVAVVR